MSNMTKKIRNNRCVNPFKKPGEKGHIGKDLRTISKRILAARPDLSDNCKVCTSCRKIFQPNPEIDDSVHNMQEEDVDMDDSAGYSAQNSQDSSVCSKGETEAPSAREIELEELLRGLKSKFLSLQMGDPLRIKILTIAPESWSVNKIAREFGASRRLAKKAKDLRSTSGILADTTAKSGKSLSPSLSQKINQFYENDLYSRTMPGIKDTVSVIIDEKRTRIQKRLLLLGLKELYVMYKESYPNDKLGFSTFAKRRPKYCILPGANGTHSVCVCTIHENCKLMLDAVDLKELSKDWEKPINNYKDCLNLSVCENPSAQCHLNECDKCPGFREFSSRLLDIFEDKCISEIQYSSWTVTDRSTLQTITSEASDFIDELCNKLEILKPHSFIAKQQSLFISGKKEDLSDGHVIVMFDFSENYAYTVQNASQAFHFNNKQCTVFPVIYYYKKESELKHQSCVFLSDSVKHDTAAVYTIQNSLIPEIKRNVRHVKKIIYMTDGAKQHFKNRFQIANLVHHKGDFGIEAEWHFSATAHGKSCYDGIGATFKREAYRASLIAKPTEAILTFDKLYNWARNHFENIKIFSFSQVQHNAMTRKLNKRFESALPVPEILKNHAFLISQQQEVIIKRFSNAADGVKVNILKTKTA